MRSISALRSDACSGIAQVPGALGFAVAGVEVMALREGALFVPSAGLLVVSDLHLEKGSAFAMRGQMLPPYDTADTLGRVEALVDRLAPDCLISLGDSFHDRRAGERLSPEDRHRIRVLAGRCDWVWITGNHDPDVPDGLGGRIAAQVEAAGLVFRHEPHPQPVVGEVAGHLHPCARISNPARSLRRRCFVTDGQRLILPAFGAYAGGLNVLDRAYEGLWTGAPSVLALGESRVVRVRSDALAPDARG